MEQKVLITGYKHYNFTNEGKTVSGVKVSYLSFSANTDSEHGFLPIQSNMDESILVKLKGPGVYLAKLNMVSGANNRAKLVVTDFEFLKTVDIAKLLD